MREVDATQVLIVGAGPVGLSLAIELGLRGIAVTMVERRSRTGAQPRAKTTNVAPCNICGAGVWPKPCAPRRRCLTTIRPTWCSRRRFRPHADHHRERLCRQEMPRSAFSGTRAMGAAIYRREGFARTHRQPSLGSNLQPGTSLEAASQSAAGVTATVCDLQNRHAPDHSRAISGRRRRREEPRSRDYRRQDDRRARLCAQLQSDPAHSRTRPDAAGPPRHHVLADQSEKARAC